MIDPGLKAIFVPLLDALDKLTASSPAIKANVDAARKALDAADAPPDYEMGGAV